MKDPSVLPKPILDYLNSENAYSEAFLKPYKTLQDKLIAEMRGRIKEDETSVPVPDGAYAYFRRYRKGGEHPIFCRLPRGAHPEESASETLIDGDAEASSKPYFQFGSLAHSNDHARLAWSYDDKGSEFYTIAVRDLKTRTDLNDRVFNTSGAMVWTNDNAAFYYVRVNADHRPQFIYKHVVGTPAEQDQLIYEEPDAGFFVSLSSTLTRRFAVIRCHDHETSECQLLDLDDSAAAPRLVAARLPGRIYSVEDGIDALYIHTNADGAEDFKIVTAPLDAPQSENWKDLIPAEAGVMRLGFELTHDHMTRLERADGLPRVIVRERANGKEHKIAFSEEAYALSLRGGYEYETSHCRFSYSSPTTPAELWDYNLDTRKRDLLKRETIPSGHDAANYVSRRLFATASDGAQVPITLLMHKDTKQDGSAPLYLYGYGSYGHAIGADFRTNPLSLVDRGFIYAIAHVRGGAEKGRGWYYDGKKEKKPNTFTDFIAAADYLVAEKFSTSGQIIAHGGSAGGMLMGAIANLRPELFAGIVAEVPFVDVLNTMLDDTLPLTPPEWPEWGNPILSAQDFKTIAAYSPYDNVVAKAYPAIFALGGLTDPRVTYWEPAKWVAKLRDKNTSTNPILLKINMSAGHGGSSGRFKHLEEIALVFAFAIAMAGKA